MFKVWSVGGGGEDGRCNSQPGGTAGVGSGGPLGSARPAEPVTRRLPGAEVLRPGL